MWEHTRGKPETTGEDSAAMPDDAAPVPTIASRHACLEQLLEAFCDIADRDDIHQAAIRLDLVHDWIRREAARAATDPLFSLAEVTH